MKNELSTKNQYWIPKYRYLELKNWCRQFEDWKKYLNDENTTFVKSKIPGRVKSSEVFKPVEELSINREKPAKSIRLLCTTAMDVYDRNSLDYDIFLYAVTKGKSYDNMCTFLRGVMPVSRDDWYKNYRKFFYLLDKRRD